MRVMNCLDVVFQGTLTLIQFLTNIALEFRHNFRNLEFIFKNLLRIQKCYNFQQKCGTGFTSDLKTINKLDSVGKY